MGHGAHEMQAGREWNGSSVVLFVLCMGIHFLDTIFPLKYMGYIFFGTILFHLH